ncbi:MAG: hypothetical protein HY094_08270 [Candidatus Melainabacteria bacterium]|nr:hypothetical protein [Candidatus Melainabacteria bacterium]
MTTIKSKTGFLKDYYFVIVPIFITILLYLVSLSYGLRNFDEDLIIKDFFVKKTFSEYLEKYLLVDWSGITKAQGFSFSSIKNVHFCILERPVFYLINFLFQSKPFLFHLLGLLLHCIAAYFFIMFTFELSQNKLISLFSGLLWSIHPTNVESIIWATNWPALLGAVFYFYTLKKVATLTNKGLINKTSIFFILLLTTIQILFIEHTITIPLAIFLTVFFQMKHLSPGKKTNGITTAFKTSIPSFLVVIGYLMCRSFFIEKNTINANHNPLLELLHRLFFLTPQAFVHQLKLVLFPYTLTIDQIDLLCLDKTFLGSYHILCIIVFISLLVLAIYFKDRFPYLSLGLLLYIIGISPFLQIIPLYSLVAERYNYFGSAFFIFGIVSTCFIFLKTKNKSLVFFLIILCTILTLRSYFRIIEWKDSSTLFLSTINTSKTFLKKGIWAYNLAISQDNESKKNELVNLSINCLKLFIQNPPKTSKLSILKSYELDDKSLLAKAAYRIATDYELLKQEKLRLEYLLKALNFSRKNSQIQSLIFKDLGTYYFQQDALEKAIKYYEKSNFISPNPTIDYAISITYLKLKDLINYEKYLKKSVSVISAYNVAPFKTYGQFLELYKNDLHGAIKYYKIASLLEDKPEPYILLATDYLKLNQIDNAFGYIQKGLNSFPHNPTLLYLHGTILINKGGKENGISDLIKVANENDSPSDIQIEACHILVNIFLKDKNLTDARKYNELVLMINPNDKEALENKNTLMVR